MKIVKQSFFYLQFLGGLGSANWVFWRSSSGAVVNSLQHAPNLVIEKYEFVKWQANPPGSLHSPRSARAAFSASRRHQAAVTGLQRGSGFLPIPFPPRRPFPLLFRHQSPPPSQKVKIPPTPQKAKCPPTSRRTKFPPSPPTSKMAKFPPPRQEPKFPPPRQGPKFPPPRQEPKFPPPKSPQLTTLILIPIALLILTLNQLPRSLKCPATRIAASWCPPTPAASRSSACSTLPTSSSRAAGRPAMTFTSSCFHKRTSCPRGWWPRCISGWASLRPGSTSCILHWPSLSAPKRGTWTGWLVVVLGLAPARGSASCPRASVASFETNRASTTPSRWRAAQKRLPGFGPFWGFFSEIKIYLFIYLLISCLGEQTSTMDHRGPSFGVAGLPRWWVVFFYLMLGWARGGTRGGITPT